jgi:ABC-2 type transport system ATP-binding protein
MPKDPVPLQFSGVTKSFRQHFWQRKRVAVRALDLRLRDGEAFGLLGPNGAGKTTTIRLALGIAHPDAGEVRLAERSASDPRSRKGVGYLPENPQFYDYLSARELVELAGRIHGLEAAERRRRAGELLERLGLAREADRPLRRFSKGMLQRAGMARALVARPSFLLLDEPMSGLDPVGRRELRDLILEERERGTTVFFSSHVLSDAEMICDRVGILVAGHLSKLLSLSALDRDRQIKWYEMEIRGPAPAGGELLSERGEERLVRLEDLSSAAEYRRAVEAAGGEMVALVPVRQSLEDLFLAEIEGEGAGEDAA